MPVPSSINDLSPTPALNSPAGSEPPSSTDDYLRTHAAFIKQLEDAKLARAGGTMTGPLTLAGNASSDLQAVPRQQVIAIAQALYPIGSIYINATSTTNPATLLGFGTWVAFGAGRVPVGQDTGDTAFDVLEETGGSKNAIVVAHTHTGTTATNGSHAHSYYASVVIGDGTAPDVDNLNGSQAGAYETASAGDHAHTFTTNSTGSSGANANLPPYIVVRMWKRTA